MKFVPLKQFFINSDIHYSAPSASSPLPTSIFSSFISSAFFSSTFLPSSIIFSSPSFGFVFSPFASIGGSLFSLSLLLLPFFFGQVILILALIRNLVSWSFLLLGSWLSGEYNFDDGQESLLLHSDEAFFFWFVNINNLPFLDVDNLVEPSDSPSHDLSHPQGLVHKPVGSFDGDGRLVFPEEKGEGPGDIAAIAGAESHQDVSVWLVLFLVLLFDSGVFQLSCHW